MNNYKTMKARHQAEFNAFPMKFAFGAKQFADRMAEWGLKPSDTDKIRCFGDTGGFYLLSDANALHEILDRHHREMDEAIANDTTGEGFIFEMFSCELGNHEYNYIGDIGDVLEIFDLTIEKIKADPRLLHGFQKACGSQSDFLTPVKG